MSDRPMAAILGDASSNSVCAASQSPECRPLDSDSEVELQRSGRCCGSCQCCGGLLTSKECADALVESSPHRRDAGHLDTALMTSALARSSSTERVEVPCTQASRMMAVRAYSPARRRSELWEWAALAQIGKLQLVPAAVRVPSALAI